MAAAQVEFDAAVAAWQAEAAQVPTRQLEHIQVRDSAGRQRPTELEAARESYRREYQKREANVAEANAPNLETLIRGVQSGTDAAIQEYVVTVLGNSVYYPAVLNVEPDLSCDSELRSWPSRAHLGA